jgi:hypothetical protein
MDDQFEKRLDLFYLKAADPTMEETVEMVKVIFAYRDKIKDLEVKLADREKFIEFELQKGMEGLKAYIMAGIS